MGNPYAWDFDLCSADARQLQLPQDVAGARLRAAARRTTCASARVRPRSSRSSRGRVEPGRRRAPPLHEQYPVVACDADAGRGDRAGAQRRELHHPGPARHRQVADDHQPHRRLRRAAASACCSSARSAPRSTSSTTACASSGLDELCCLIHDSQADKKAFVDGPQADLRGVARGRVVPGAGGGPPAGRPGAARGRRRGSRGLRVGPAPTPRGEGGPRLRDLIERLIDLRDARGRRPAAGARRYRSPPAAWWRERPAHRRARGRAASRGATDASRRVRCGSLAPAILATGATDRARRAVRRAACIATGSASIAPGRGRRHSRWSQVPSPGPRRGGWRAAGGERPLALLGPAAAWPSAQCGRRRRSLARRVLDPGTPTAKPKAPAGWHALPRRRRRAALDSRAARSARCSGSSSRLVAPARRARRRYDFDAPRRASVPASTLSSSSWPYTMHGPRSTQARAPRLPSVGRGRRRGLRCGRSRDCARRRQNDPALSRLARRLAETADDDLAGANWPTLARSLERRPSRLLATSRR